MPAPAVTSPRNKPLPHRPPLMIEHMRGAEEYDKCRRHLFELGDKIGVGFE